MWCSCTCCGWGHHRQRQCGITALTHIAPSLWWNVSWSEHWDGQQFRGIVPKPPTAASSLKAAEDLFLWLWEVHNPCSCRVGDIHHGLCRVYWFIPLGCLPVRSQGKRSNRTPEVMDQLCNVALLLQSGIQQRSDVPCGKLNQDFLLGQKFCLEGFSGLLLHEKEMRKAQRMTTRI